jgi:hypothetical protein
MKRYCCWWYRDNRAWRGTFFVTYSSSLLVSRPEY